jgi:hypothetical protein
LLFLVLVGLVIGQERSQAFAAAAQKEGSALIDLAETRSQLLQRRADESIEHYEQRIAAENAETQSTYSQLHARQVARLRDGFARRRLKKLELDEFYQKPGSAVAIGEIGRALSDMSMELSSKGVSALVKDSMLRLVHPSAIILPAGSAIDFSSCLALRTARL